MTGDECPYIHSEYNPVTNSEHETLLWKYSGCIAALFNQNGTGKGTIQFAQDGINFEMDCGIGETWVEMFTRS